MRILLVGDVHGNANFLMTALDQANLRGCDRLFCLGDFGAWEHMAMGREFFDDAMKHASKRGLTVYWLDGNHDKTSLVKEMYGQNETYEGFWTCRHNVLYAPRGHRWTWDGVSFMALGGAYSVDKGWRLAQELHDRERYDRNTSGTLWFPEEEMTDDDLDNILLCDSILLGDSSSVDVMLTHDKPRSSNPGWNQKDLPECWPNQDRIERAVQALKPRYLFHGHLHHRYSQEILVGGDRWCSVEALAADPQAMGRYYVKGDSWYVLDTETLEIEKED